MVRRCPRVRFITGWSIILRIHFLWKEHSIAKKSPAVKSLTESFYPLKILAYPSRISTIIIMLLVNAIRNPSEWSHRTSMNVCDRVAFPALFHATNAPLFQPINSITCVNEVSLRRQVVLDITVLIHRTIRRVHWSTRILLRRSLIIPMKVSSLVLRPAPVRRHIHQVESVHRWNRRITIGSISLPCQWPPSIHLNSCQIIRISHRKNIRHRYHQHQK